MNELIQMLKSPTWWFSVVVVGIIINLVSAYVKSPIDENLSKISTWWRKRTDKQKKELNAVIENLSKNEHEQVMTAVDDLRERIRSIHLLIFGIFIMLAANELDVLLPNNAAVQIGSLAFASVCYFLSFLSFNNARMFKRKLNLSRKEKIQELKTKK